MELTPFLNKNLIFIGESFESTDDFYEAFAKFLKEKEVIKDHKIVKRLFVKRESIQSTAIGKGAAAPHIFSKEFSTFIFSIALIRKGVDFKAPNEKKVFVVFLIMSDERDVGLHLKSLAHIARLVSSTNFVREIKESKGVDEIINILGEKEKRL
jgi:mannitol/fructose-specific phosphotransferase system IIA component (Ntr-type)